MIQVANPENFGVVVSWVDDKMKSWSGMAVLKAWHAN